MPVDESWGAALLEHTYEDLDLLGGALIEAAPTPSPGVDLRTWRELGDWLLLAARVGAERIFFVNDDPVLVFSSLPAGASERDVMALYRRAWSLARPRCLFVAVGNELRVYALTRPPALPGTSQEAMQPIEVVRRATDVTEALARFHRDRLESGVAFEDADLVGTSGRADQRLLRDVRAATDALIDSGLAPRVSHGLIERAILVRYLEDRGVLTESYFAELVQDSAHWQDLLSEPGRIPDLGPPSSFVRCLADKALTYTLFKRLARDFNGDLFVAEADEQRVVNDEQLRLLGDLLQGVADAAQEPLFLWAYDFSVVPTSLVSTMYELFYHQEAGGSATSTYYTPSQLVEFVLADVLDAETLERDPTVCDPACGSGVFLVEAYRRIVRYEAARVGQPLSSTRLRRLLLERIAGCDTNESAVKLAAFSLYVAFLNYQTPQDIRQAGPLPPLIWREGTLAQAAPLVVADAFRPTGDDESSAVADESTKRSPWPMRGFDVVVGNPPWGEPRKRIRSLAERWAVARGLPVGDRSPSQLFLWRALDLLARDGLAALLVSAKVVFNTRTTSKAFRARWLAEARVERVVNFSQVRRNYFEQGVAPFMLLRFRRAYDSADGPVVYETARAVPQGRRGSPALARLDRRIVAQSALRARDYLWKTYSAGGHRDDALLSRLELEGRLRDLLPAQPRSQYGYQRAKPDDPSARPVPSDWRDLRSLATFKSWGPLAAEWFEPLPEYVKRTPNPRVFRGRRLLVRRGVASTFGPHARLEYEPFAFRHTTYAIPLEHRSAWEAQVALGTVLSALGRYWLYMVAGSWGTWNDEIRAEDILEMPLRLWREHPATSRIIAAVDLLPRSSMAGLQLAGGNGHSSPDTHALLQQIDEAVADLFELTSAERDLVADFWAGQQSTATEPVPSHGGQRGAGGLDRYLDVFLQAWRPQLGDSAEFGWRIWRDPRADVIAAVFETRHPGQPSHEEDDVERFSWSTVLERLGLALGERHAGTLLAHGMIRAVADSAIIIIKRDEQRLWTASAAREDAEATTAQVIALQRA